MRRTCWYRVALLLATAVTVASLLPAGTPGPVPIGGVALGCVGVLGVDKLLHALGFLAIAVTAARGAESSRELLVVAALAIALGGGIELAQSLIPGRTPEVFDFFADVVGVGIGTAVHVLWPSTE